MLTGMEERNRSINKSTAFDFGLLKMIADRFAHKTWVSESLVKSKNSAYTATACGDCNYENKVKDDSLRM
jgi:hypothetical protein